MALAHRPTMSSLQGEKNADPGEAPKSSVEHPESGPPVQVNGDASDSGYNEAKDRPAEKPARRKRRNPRLPSDNQYGTHHLRRSEQLQSKR